MFAMLAEIMLSSFAQAPRTPSHPRPISPSSGMKSKLTEWGQLFKQLARWEIKMRKKSSPFRRGRCSSTPARRATPEYTLVLPDLLNIQKQPEIRIFMYYRIFTLTIRSGLLLLLPTQAFLVVAPGLQSVCTQ